MRKEHNPFDALFGDLAKLLNDPTQLVPMPTDVRKADGKLELHIYVPGVKREEISIDFDHKNKLTISVERAEESLKESQKGWVSVESLYAKSSKRQFHISDELDKDSIEASLNDGILVITFKEKEKEKQEPVKIQIK